MVERIKRRLTDSKDNLAFAVLILIAAISILLSLWSNADGATPNWISGLFQNLGSGIVGALVTYFLFDRIMQRRADKERLIRALSSPDRATALNALREARAPEQNWLYDGSLQYADLNGVNWQDTGLEEVNLQYALLRGANLKGTDLTSSNLQGVDLRFANLQSANLELVNLQEAKLKRAKMQDVYLNDADLQGADMTYAYLHFTDLTGANLQNAILKNTGFDETTRLPDGEYWQSDTDLTRFTDPKHPNFWRSDNPTSPAYRAPSD